MKKTLSLLTLITALCGSVSYGLTAEFTTETKAVEIDTSKSYDAGGSITYSDGILKNADMHDVTFDLKYATPNNEGGLSQALTTAGIVIVAGKVTNTNSDEAFGFYTVGNGGLTGGWDPNNNVMAKWETQGTVGYNRFAGLDTDNDGIVRLTAWFDNSGTTTIQGTYLVAGDSVPSGVTGSSLKASEETDPVKLYGAVKLRGSGTDMTTITLNSNYVTKLYVNDTFTTAEFSNAKETWNKTYTGGKYIAVTDGQVTMNGNGDAAPKMNNSEIDSSKDIIVGKDGSLFLQTWSTDSQNNLNLSNTIYLGDSTKTGPTGGSIHFGNDDDNSTTTLSGKIYLVENATLKARGAKAINITGTVTDKNVPGSTDTDGGYKLTLAGKGYNFTETSNVDVTTLEFAETQAIHTTTSATTSATFKNGFSADNLIMNVGNEITSEKAISGLTSLEVLGSGKATLAADLDLTSLSTLKLNATLNLSDNALTLGNAITLTGGKLAVLQEIGNIATIFEGVSSFNGVASSTETVIFDASEYFTNLPTENQYVLTYTNGNVAIKLIPEPTTATLSLLALAGLAARRRRR